MEGKELVTTEEVRDSVRFEKGVPYIDTFTEDMLEDTDMGYLRAKAKKFVQPQLIKGESAHPVMQRGAQSLELDASYYLGVGMYIKYEF